MGIIWALKTSKMGLFFVATTPFCWDGNRCVSSFFGATGSSSSSGSSRICSSFWSSDCLICMFFSCSFYGLLRCFSFFCFFLSCCCVVHLDFLRWCCLGFITSWLVNGSLVVYRYFEQTQAKSFLLNNQHVLANVRCIYLLSIMQCNVPSIFARVLSSLTSISFCWFFVSQPPMYVYLYRCLELFCLFWASNQPKFGFPRLEQGSNKFEVCIVYLATLSRLMINVNRLTGAGSKHLRRCFGMVLGVKTLRRYQGTLRLHGFPSNTTSISWSCTVGWLDGAYSGVG